VIVAGGDGGVRKMVQSPQSREWAVVKHISLPGGVVSMCRSLDEHQIIVSTTSGAMIRILTSDLSFAVAAQAPLGAITDLAIAEDAPEIFATASTDGVVRIWDLSTYSVRSTATATSGTQQQQQQPSQSNPAHAFRTSTAGGAGGNINNAMIAAPDGAPSAIVPTSIAFVPATRGAFAVAGWSDGRIRGIDFRHGATGVVQWSAPAHKGRVNSVQVTAQYILTSGSEDSAVRIWTLTTRELAGQMQDHKAPVAAAATDVTTDVIVHSCGADGVMCSYDISKTNPNPSVKSCQRVATHSYALGGPFTCIAQRRDHEREVIVGTHEGRVAFFDMDVADPVLVIEDKRRARVTCVSVSPTGQYLVVGSADGTLSLYELFSQDGGVCAPILQCACHSTGVARAQWAGDGRQVITGGTDGEVLVWNFFTMPKPGY
jgi:WD40 repeat protein